MPEKKIIPTSEISETIDRLNRQAWEINRDEPEKAIQISEEAAQLAKSSGYELGMARAQHNMGMCYGWLSQFEKALELTEGSLQVFKKNKSGKDSGRCLYSIGTIHYYRGDFKNAKKCYLESLENYKNADYKTGVTNAYNGLGSVYTELGNFEEASDYLSKGLQLSQEIDEFKIRPKILDGLASICSRQKDFVRAKEYLEQGQKMSLETNQKQYETFFIEGIGECYMNLGDHTKALDYLNKSLVSRKEMGLKFGEATTLQKIGMVYLKTGKMELAEESLIKALDLANEIEGEGIAMGIYKSLSKLYEEKKDTKRFGENLKKYYELKEQLLSEEQLKAQNYKLEQAYLNTKVLSEIGQEIIASLELEKVLFTIYDKVNKLMDATVFGIGLYLPEEHAIEYKLSVAKGQKYLPYKRDTTDKNQLAVWCLDNKDTIFINDFDNEHKKFIPGFSMEYELELVDKGGSGQSKLEQSMIYVPIKNGEEVIGVITVQSFDKNVYSKHHLDILKNIAVYAAIALINVEMYETLEQKIDERTNELLKEKEKAEFEREEAKYQRRRAEKSEQFKQQFLANMSHEIRTPMNAIMGMTNLLMEKKLPDEAFTYLDSIKKSSESLLVIINDILDLSKIEAGKMVLEQTDFSLQEVLRLVELTLSYKADEKGLILSVKCDEEIPPVLIGDPVRLQQILMNIAGNAVKFTEKGGVTIRVDREGGMVEDNQCKMRFEIRDTGIGMDSEQQLKVFENFSQASADTTRKYGGTGLGLSISSKLIELFGSVIRLESEPGMGSVFSFTINLPISQNTKAVNKESEIPEDFINELQGISILLAEDNEYNQIVATETLELKIPGVKVSRANNGEEALKMMQQGGGNFDVILMDVQMPVMDGFDATRNIRKIDAEYGKIPIIALTASVIKKDIQMCYDAGMNGFVPKPFKTSELIEAIYKAYKLKSNGIELKQPKPNNMNEQGNITSMAFLEDFTEGDKDRMNKYIGMYLDSARKNIPSLQDYMSAEKWDELKVLVHSMKPHFDFMGMRDTRTLAENIEQVLVEKKDLNSIPDKIGELIQSIEKSIEELSS